MGRVPLHAAVRFWRDDNLPGVEARSSSYASKAFRPHTHLCPTIALVDSGATRFTLGLGEAAPCHDARAGHIVTIPAGVPHACNPEPGAEFRYRLLAFPAEMLADRQPRTVIDDPELFAALSAAHEAFAQGLPAAQKRALLTEGLGLLARRHARLAPAEPAQPPAVRLARAAIESAPGDLLPLPELARLAGLSQHHFLRVFKAATGMTPHAYQLQRAIEHAKTLLAAGADISHAAQETGFADQSHFSRLFRKFTGATPRQYVDAGRPAA